jgi:hypothetical protein
VQFLFESKRPFLNLRLHAGESLGAMHADRVAGAYPRQCNEDGRSNNNRDPTGLAKGSALGGHLGAPIAPGMTVLVDQKPPIWEAGRPVTPL